MIPSQNEVSCTDNVTVGEINDFGTSGPPTPVGQTLHGFNGGWSLITKSLVRILVSPAVMKFNRYEPGFFLVGGVIYYKVKRIQKKGLKLVCSVQLRRTRTRRTFGT